MNIKKGDNVKVIAGADRGKSGHVLRAFPKTGRVVVEGINMTSKHQRARKSGEKGTRIKIAMPIHASNVKKID